MSQDKVFSSPMNKNKTTNTHERPFKAYNKSPTNCEKVKKGPSHLRSKDIPHQEEPKKIEAKVHNKN